MYHCYWTEAQTRSMYIFYVLILVGIIYNKTFKFIRMLIKEFEVHNPIGSGNIKYIKKIQNKLIEGFYFLD